MRIWIKRIGILILIPIALVFVLSVVLYIPPFQNFAVQQAAKYAGEATGMRIGIERLRLSFPLDLEVKGVEVMNLSSDTLLIVRELTVHVRALPLLKKQIVVDAVDLKGVKLNTGSLIEGMEIKGMLGRLKVKAEGVDLADEKALLNSIELSDTAITLLLNDSVAEQDTTTAPINWKLELASIALSRVSFALQIPSDSLRFTAYVDKAGLRDGRVDLATARYGASGFDIVGSTFNYDANYAIPTKGFDPSHIALNDVNASLDSLFYGGKEMGLRIRDLSAKERSGLAITSLAGRMVSDEETIHLPGLLLRMPDSEAHLSASVPWSSLEEEPVGAMNALLTASLGKEDLLFAVEGLPEAFKKSYPDKPLNLTLEVGGNLSDMHIRQFEATLPDALRMKASGGIAQLTDSIRRAGEIRLQAETGNLSFLLSMLPASMGERFVIPRGIRLEGNASFGNRQYEANATLSQDRGTVVFEGIYNAKIRSYVADIKVDSLEPTHFMPNDSLYWLTATAHAEGQGVDPFSVHTRAKLEAKIADIRYGATSVSNVTLDGLLEENELKVDLLSKYPLAKMDLSLNATLKEKDVKAMLIADVNHLDLHGMHLITEPFATSFQLFAEAESDLGEDNDVDITLGNWEVITPKERFKPKTLTLHLRSDVDTTRVSLHTGDLGMVLTGNDCFHDIMDKLTRSTNDIGLQLERDSAVNLNKLRPLLPDMYLEVKAGQDNPIYNYLQSYYLGFKSMAMNAYTSPETGIRMDASILDLGRDELLLDTIRADIRQDSLGLRYGMQVIKNKYRQQQPFIANLSGQISHGFADARFHFKDGQGQTGLLLGIRADKVPGGARLSLFPENPIIAFRPFKLNKGNYVIINSLKDIAADLRLTGDENASLWIHSGSNETGFDEVHAELSQIDLGVISAAFNYLPPMQGMLNADFQYAPSDSSFMVLGNVNVDDLFYEEERVGEMMFNAVYLPLAEDEHQIDLHLFRDRNEIASSTALYRMGETDHISGSLNFTHFPLDMVNAFIPQDMAKMGGDVDGTLTIEGQSKAPVAEGYLVLDTASVFVGALGSTFRFDDRRIEVKNNRVLFDKYRIYASGDNPFVIDGNVDLGNLSRTTADLRMTASDLQLLNVKKNNESLVYGKLFVDLNSTVKGPLDALMMRGDLRLLGNTNVAYVLKDSPLMVQDRMSDMVTFVSFADTVRRKVTKKPPLPLGGLDMLMTIRVDPAVQATVDLGGDQSNRINLEGGGDLSFQYTPQGDMFLNGRYTLSGGTVRYALPVIPLKDFSIKDGSYVQWTGNVMNPLLNLTATERVRTSVSLNDQSPRLINFDVGIELNQQLENLGLQFTLEAPEDMSMQEELTSKGVEERAKLAVSMLVTGMYLGGGTGGSKVNMNMGNALSSFLQSEISNAVDGVKAVDISIGMETYEEKGEKGSGTRTDYSFRFAKRFYNDRIRVILGGRISTGDNINDGQAQPFIDNISVEYRLDNSGARYVKLFYDKNYESILEGEITETGAGIVLRKKMMSLHELFIFKKTKVKPTNQEEEKK